MDILCQIQEIALQSSLFETGYVEISHLRYYPEVRAACEKNVCRAYGTTWACPPAVGTLDECRERVEQYDKMLLFSKKYELEDSFDFEGMTAGMHDFKKSADRFADNLKEVLSDYMLFSNEGCEKCSECTYPNAPCRFPQSLHPSLESYGFIVSELANEAGVRYNNGPNTVTYFGALLFNPKDASVE